jgi:enoyl-CoA hydratase
MAMLSDLCDALYEAEIDPHIRAVVLTGTGDRAFCAGMDLRSFRDPDMSEERASEVMARFQQLLAGEISVPLVGAANASALAGGLELLMGCDIVVASSQAFFGLPEVSRGLFPGGNGTTLGTRIPLAIALELALTGDRIDADRALSLGLINAVVDPDDVLPTAIAYAERIARNAPLSVAAVKELVRLWVTDPARAAERLPQLQKAVFESEDAQEGARAFVEKRDPRWLGR